jgi:hypothetical protein
MGHDDADEADLAGLAGEVRALRRQVEELRDGGGGVVPPWIPIAFWPVRAQDLPAVTSPTFETVWETLFTKLYPFVGLSTVQACDVGTSGVAEVVATDMESGLAEVVDTWPVSGSLAGACTDRTSWRTTAIPVRSGSLCGIGGSRAVGRCGCPWWTPPSTRRTEVCGKGL